MQYKSWNTFYIFPFTPTIKLPICWRFPSKFSPQEILLHPLSFHFFFCRVFTNHFAVPPHCSGSADDVRGNSMQIRFLLAQLLLVSPLCSDSPAPGTAPWACLPVTGFIFIYFWFKRQQQQQQEQQRQWQRAAIRSGWRQPLPPLSPPCLPLTCAGARTINLMPWQGSIDFETICYAFRVNYA